MERHIVRGVATLTVPCTVAYTVTFRFVRFNPDVRRVPVNLGRRGVKCQNTFSEVSVTPFTLLGTLKFLLLTLGSTGLPVSTVAVGTRVLEGRGKDKTRVCVKRQNQKCFYPSTVCT